MSAYMLSDVYLSPVPYKQVFISTQQPNAWMHKHMDRHIGYPETICDVELRPPRGLGKFVAYRQHRWDRAQTTAALPGKPFNRLRDFSKYWYFHKIYSRSKDLHPCPSTRHQHIRECQHMGVFHPYRTYNYGIWHPNPCPMANNDLLTALTSGRIPWYDLVPAR